MSGISTNALSAMASLALIGCAFLSVAGCSDDAGVSWAQAEELKRALAGVGSLPVKTRRLQDTRHKQATLSAAPTIFVEALRPRAGAAQPEPPLAKLVPDRVHWSMAPSLRNLRNSSNAGNDLPDIQALGRTLKSYFHPRRARQKELL